MIFFIGSGEFVQVVSDRRICVKNARKQIVMSRYRDVEMQRYKYLPQGLERRCS